MPNLIETTIHSQVRIFVAMLCEGFNVPSSETKIQAFANKLKHPNVPALMETYEIFTDGRGATKKMPTIAEVMEVYRGVTKRMDNEEKTKIEHKEEINYSKNKYMFKKLINMQKKGEKPRSNILNAPVTGWLGGYEFTLTRDELGRDNLQFHNHPKYE